MDRQRKVTQPTDQGSRWTLGLIMVAIWLTEWWTPDNILKKQPFSAALSTGCTCRWAFIIDLRLVGAYVLTTRCFLPVIPVISAIFLPVLLVKRPMEPLAVES